MHSSIFIFTLIAVLATAEPSNHRDFRNVFRTGKHFSYPQGFPPTKFTAQGRALSHQISPDITDFGLICTQPVITVTATVTTYCDPETYSTPARGKYTCQITIRLKSPTDMPSVINSTYSGSHFHSETVFEQSPSVTADPERTSASLTAIHRIPVATHILSTVVFKNSTLFSTKSVVVTITSTTVVVDTLTKTRVNAHTTVPPPDSKTEDYIDGGFVWSENVVPIHSSIPALASIASSSRSSQGSSTSYRSSKTEALDVHPSATYNPIDELFKLISHDVCRKFVYRSVPHANTMQTPVDDTSEDDEDPAEPSGSDNEDDTEKENDQADSSTEDSDDDPTLMHASMSETSSRHQLSTKSIQEQHTWSSTKTKASSKLETLGESLSTKKTLVQSHHSTATNPTAIVHSITTTGSPDHVLHSNSSKAFPLDALVDMMTKSRMHYGSSASSSGVSVIATENVHEAPTPLVDIVTTIGDTILVEHLIPTDMISQAAPISEQSSESSSLAKVASGTHKHSVSASNSSPTDNDRIPPTSSVQVKGTEKPSSSASSKSKAIAEGPTLDSDVASPTTWKKPETTMTLPSPSPSTTSLTKEKWPSSVESKAASFSPAVTSSSTSSGLHTITRVFYGPDGSSATMLMLNWPEVKPVPSSSVQKKEGSHKHSSSSTASTQSHSAFTKTATSSSTTVPSSHTTSGPRIDISTTVHSLMSITASTTTNEVPTSMTERGSHGILRHGAESAEALPSYMWFLSHRVRKPVCRYKCQEWETCWKSCSYHKIGKEPTEDDGDEDFPMTR